MEARRGEAREAFMPGRGGPQPGGGQASERRGHPMFFFWDGIHRSVSNQFLGFGLGGLWASW